MRRLRHSTEFGQVMGIAYREKRRLSLRWFEPNTCDQLKSQVMTGTRRSPGRWRWAVSGAVGSAHVGSNPAPAIATWN